MCDSIYVPNSGLIFDQHLGKRIHEIFECFATDRFRTVGMQLRDAFKGHGVAIDNSHRPGLKYFLLRWRDVNELAAAVSPIVEDLEI